MTRPSWGRLAFATIALAGVIVCGGLRHASADDVPADQAAGTVALISGKAWVRQGDITLPTPDSEGTVSPNVTFKDPTGRELGPNDHIQSGDVVVTGEDSYLKIYYRDDSIMDVAPNTTVKVSQFQLTPQSTTSNRQITFTLLQGKVRTLVTRALDQTSYYRVETPTSSMGVHGTEWVTNSYPQNGQYRTDVTVLEGKVVVDMPKPSSAGTKTGGAANIEQLPVTPGHTYSAVGNGGSVSKYSVFKLSNDQIKELAAMVPNIETTRVGDITRVVPQHAAVETTPTVAQTGATTGSAGPASSGTAVAAAANANERIASGGARSVSFSAPPVPMQVAQQRPGGGGSTAGSAGSVAATASSVVAVNNLGGRGPASSSMTATSVLNAREAAASLERPAGAIRTASVPPAFVPQRAHIQAPPAVLAPPTTGAVTAASVGTVRH